MRPALGYMTELAGVACIVTAAYFVSPILALAVAGLVLVVLAQAAKR